MKYLQLLLIPVIFSGSSCAKHQYSPKYPPRDNTTIHTGKVLAAMCGNVIVQFTDGAQYGQNGWQDPVSSSGAKLNHVFRVSNACTWGGADVNSEIRFRFTPLVAQTCAFCMAYIPTPDTAYSIEVIK